MKKAYIITIATSLSILLLTSCKTKTESGDTSTSTSEPSRSAFLDVYKVEPSQKTVTNELKVKKLEKLFNNIITEGKDKKRNAKELLIPSETSYAIEVDDETYELVDGFLLTKGSAYPVADTDAVIKQIQEVFRYEEIKEGELVMYTKDKKIEKKLTDPKKLKALNNLMYRLTAHQKAVDIDHMKPSPFAIELGKDRYTFEQGCITVSGDIAAYSKTYKIENYDQVVKEIAAFFGEKI